MSSQNLGEALLWIAGGIAVLALIAGLAVWLARRRGSRTIAIDAADAVAALGAVFRHGGVRQRDTEGLV